MYKKTSTIDVLFCILMIFIIIIGYISIYQGHIIGGDSTLYIRQTESILNGDISDVQDVMVYMLANSSDDKFSPILYPWGFPILLTPVYMLFGLDFYCFKLYGLLFYVGAIVFLYFLFRQKENFKWQAFFIALLIGMQTKYLAFLNLVLSEIPYLFFISFSIYMLNRVYGKGIIERDKILSYVGVGILLMFTAQIRTEGVLLFPALGVVLLCYFIRNKSKILVAPKGFMSFLGLASLPYVAGGLFYLLLNLCLPSGFLAHVGHFEMFSKELLLSNLEGYFLSFRYFQPLGNTWGIAIFLLLVFWGMVKCFRKDTLEVSFVVFSILLLSVWPHQNTRHLFALLPFMLYFVVRAVESFTQEGKAARLSVTILSIIFLFNFPVTLNFGFHHASAESQGTTIDSAEAKELADYIIKNTSSDEVIGFAHSRALYLLSGRNTLSLWGPIEHTWQVADWYIYCKDVDSYFQYTNQEIKHNQSFFEERFHNSKFIVYKINKP